MCWSIFLWRYALVVKEKMLVMEKVEPPWFVLIRCDITFFWQQHPIWQYGVFVFVQNYFFRQEINILSLDWSTTGLLAQVFYFTNRILIVIVKAGFRVRAYRQNPMTWHLSFLSLKVNCLLYTSTWETQTSRSSSYQPSKKTSVAKQIPLTSFEALINYNWIYIFFTSALPRKVLVLMLLFLYA